MTSSREELLSRFQVVRDSLAASAAELANVRDEIIDVADRQTWNGHYGIADAYRSASEQAENIADLLRVADDGLETAMGAIAATEWAPDTRTGIDPGSRQTEPDPSATLPDESGALAIRREIAPHVGKRKTIGIMTTMDGTRIGDEIWSGQHPPGSGGPGLKSPWKHMTIMDHVESHVAAMMRAGGPREAVLYLSRRPCADKANNCNRHLPSLLPEGYTIHVRQINTRGEVAFRRAYIGTGEAIDHG